MKKADLGMSDLVLQDRHKQHFEVPPGLEVKVDLEYLVLRTSRGSKSVVSFLRCCSKLTTFPYYQTIGRASGKLKLDGQL